MSYRALSVLAGLAAAVAFSGGCGGRLNGGSSENGDAGVKGAAVSSGREPEGGSGSGTGGSFTGVSPGSASGGGSSGSSSGSTLVGSSGGVVSGSSGGGVACMPDGTVIGCANGSYGFSCVGSETPDQTDSTLNCNAGVANGSFTNFCCLPSQDTWGASTCALGHSIAAICATPGSFGFRCAGLDTPDQTDLRLTCSAGVPEASGTFTDFCCVE